MVVAKLRVNSSYPPSESVAPWYGSGYFSLPDDPFPPQTPLHKVFAVHVLQDNKTCHPQKTPVQTRTLTFRSARPANDSLLAAVKANSTNKVNDVLAPELKMIGKQEVDARGRGMEGLMNIRSLRPQGGGLIEEVSTSSSSSSSPPPGEAVLSPSSSAPTLCEPIFSCVLSPSVACYADSRSLFGLVLPGMKSVEVRMPALPEGVTIRGLKRAGEGRVTLAVGKIKGGGSWDAWRPFEVEEVDIDVDVKAAVEVGGLPVKEGRREAALEIWHVATLALGALVVGVAVGTALTTRGRRR